MYNSKLLRFLRRIGYPEKNVYAVGMVGAAFVAYVALVLRLHPENQEAAHSLAIIPIIGGGWFFGLRGGILFTALSIMLDLALHSSSGQLATDYFRQLDVIIGSLALLFIGLIIGTLGTVTRQRYQAINRLEKLEKERKNYADFLESLHDVTRVALESDNLDRALKILVEGFGKLFQADDCLFSFWDESQKVTRPMYAYGSVRDLFPTLVFEPGERTVAFLVMQAGRALAIPDIRFAPRITKKLTSILSSRSILGVPLILEGDKIASFTLGYNAQREFDEQDITYAEIAAQQIAMVLTKLQLLEDTQLRVKQLTMLHEVAVTATEVDNIDQLIERTTEVIGRNLFPDNFGILLVDDKREVLLPHPSYRFGSVQGIKPPEIPLGKGVSGRVAQTGTAIRLGNISETNYYIDVDERTVSELCVPIKIKNQILGVINTESAKSNAFTADDEFLLTTLAGQLATAIEQLRAEVAERRWLEQLAHSNDLIYALAHITTHIEKALQPDQIIQVLGSELKKINLACVMAFYESETGLFTINYASMDADLLERFERGTGFPLINHSFPGEKMVSSLGKDEDSQSVAVTSTKDEVQIFSTRNTNKDIVNILQEAGIASQAELIRLPLMFEDNLLGILWVWGSNLTKADLPVMSIFSKQIGISLERARLFQEVQNLALTDSLTGLHNRRSLFELGRIEFSRANRFNRPFSCLMLDLDHFKQINDEYGHQAGDLALQEFARLCRDSVREIDLVGRYGGEEIIVLMPDTELETAFQAAERLRLSVSETKLDFKDQILKITVSIGVAAKDENTNELETLVARADQAMYIAKHKGRNRVAVSK